MKAFGYSTYQYFWWRRPVWKHLTYVLRGVSGKYEAMEGLLSTWRIGDSPNLSFRIDPLEKRNISCHTRSWLTVPQLSNHWQLLYVMIHLSRVYEHERQWGIKNSKECIWKICHSILQSAFPFFSYPVLFWDYVWGILGLIKLWFPFTVIIISLGIVE